MFKRYQEAYDLGGSLECQGWELTKNRPNRDSSLDIKGLAKEFSNSVGNNDACFIYFAGHTLQV